MNSHQRRKQRRKYIREVEQRIMDDEYNNTFTTNQYIDESGFVDFLFIGIHHGKKVIWNACMTTAIGDYFDHVHDIAMDEAYEKYPTPEGYDPLKFVPHLDDAGNDTGMFELAKQPEFEELNDTRYRWMAERAIWLFDNKQYSIPSTNVEIDPTYKYGVGLHIRIDKDGINVEDVLNFIKDFNDGTSIESEACTCLTSKELGVELQDNSNFVQWVDRGDHNTVAIK